LTAPDHLRRHDGVISRTDRERRLGQRGGVVWFTGLSGSGKSSVARAVEASLARAGRLVYVLDGDNIRHGLCSDLGFSAVDRSENIRRISHVAALFVDVGAIVLTAFISPFRADRAQARTIVGAADFLEVFVDTPLAVCEQRDPKGLYRQARAGQLAEFTGISSPYEAPLQPDLHLHNADRPLAEAAAITAALLHDRGWLTAPLP
jgi:adenylylsulfate kinase